jgi:arylsulfatase
VLIMADDMGFADLGCYGSEVQTPNIVGLAKRGIRFRNFYNTARCCPTRASLLTGLYSHQAGVGHMTADWGKPGYRGTLNQNCVTIAEVLRQAGYGCYISGKWHVAGPGKRENFPLQRGFDKYFGTLAGGGNYYYPQQLMRGNEFITAPEQGFFYTDAIAENAIRFLDEHKADRARDPFFLYVPFTAPHWPLHALEPEIAKYRDVFRSGWDEARTRRHRRQIDLGVVSEEWALSPRDPVVPAWAEAPNKEWEIERMSVYAAQIDRLDQNVGKILRQLPDNTLVLFLSDTGSSAEVIKDTPAAWRNTPFKVRGGNDPTIMPGPRDTFQSCGPSWAQVSNTPFRRYKMWVHEGGIAAPLIAAWPGRIRKPGSFTDSTGHVIDLMATCCDAAGVSYPKTFQGRTITPLEGRSLVPLIEGRPKENHPRLFWEHEGNQAVREGRWKLVRLHEKPWELYDIEADRTELHDLAAKEPAVVARLSEQYAAWMKRVGALPYDEARPAPKPATRH